MVLTSLSILTSVIIVIISFWIYSLFFNQAKKLPEKWNDAFIQKLGPWALITGASYGLGEEFVKQLAKQGINCILVARSECKIIKTLQDQYPKVQFKEYRKDLSDLEQVKELVELVKDMPIGLLINNAGSGYVGSFIEQETDRLISLVNLNCTSQVLLTSKLLPGMKSRGHGAIIFVSSGAAYQPLPLHAIYAASKSFSSFLGAALWYELSKIGIDVLTIEPGTINTNFSKTSGTIPHRGVDPKLIVEDAFASLYEHRISSIYGLFNRTRAFLALYAPKSWVLSIAEKRMKRIISSTSN